MKSLARTFSPPPRKSVTTWPLSWNPGPDGSSAAADVADDRHVLRLEHAPRADGGRDAWATRRRAADRSAPSPPRSPRRSLAAHTRRFAPGTPHGTDATASIRSSSPQNAAIARFNASEPRYSRSTSLPANWVAANVGNTSWAANPSASSTWLRSVDSKAPTAPHPLACSSSIGSSASATAPEAGPFGRFGHGTIGQGTRPAERERAQLFACRVVGELLEPAREFHHMTVGVEHDAIPCIRHARERTAPEDRVEPRCVSVGARGPAAGRDRRCRSRSGRACRASPGRRQDDETDDRDQARAA